MEKILYIDGKPVKLKSTGAFMLRYKQQFHRDALKDLYKLQEAVEEETNEETGETVQIIKDIEALNLEIFFDMIWTLAKTANPQIPPAMEWLDTFDEFPLEEILPEALKLIMASMGSTVESKKK
ncbi:hypothetical protein [Aminipila luticellarii]|uniref:Tail assembly chaperone n=1 Tax=Aminipila luticellarii TaxID=2507160 RepID=A0A410PWX5_9FIRM|nr:hypothetical protein [Aminipila luticellarii]QAT43439.1 hypothetical protein EQM06_09550 [Aminipila luticellarii]